MFGVQDMIMATDPSYLFQDKENHRESSNINRKKNSISRLDLSISSLHPKSKKVPSKPVNYNFDLPTPADSDRKVGHVL